MKNAIAIITLIMASALAKADANVSFLKGKLEAILYVGNKCEMAIRFNRDPAMCEKYNALRSEIIEYLTPEKIKALSGSSQMEILEINDLFDRWGAQSVMLQTMAEAHTN